MQTTNWFKFSELHGQKRCFYSFFLIQKTMLINPNPFGYISVNIAHLLLGFGFVLFSSQIQICIRWCFLKVDFFRLRFYNMIQVNQQWCLGEEDLLMHVFSVQNQNPLSWRALPFGKCRVFSNPKPTLCKIHSYNWVLLVYPNNQKATNSWRQDLLNLA